MKEKGKVVALITAIVSVLIVAFVFYYLALPAVNIHSPGFWVFLLILLCLAACVYYPLTLHFTEVFKPNGKKTTKLEFKTRVQKTVGVAMGGITIVLFVAFIIGGIASAPIVNASKYQKLLTPETRDFNTDIHEVSYDKIPVLDRDSAVTIGNRVMGTMVDMVSQFEVSDMYSQINYQDKPVRVSPLQYGNLIKWFSNYSDGIPAYIRIDMTTQQAECIRLSEAIRYSKSDHFGRNIYRHLRFACPTYIFDEINFEINEEGTPYWICPVKKYNIGLFGGVTIGRVVLCNAVTGELTDYTIDEVPEWVDKVYSADLLIDLYDYHGTLKHGFLNSKLSQKDCLRTTDGYNYVALEDDIWVYTGITSVGQDESNVGFILMNQRTMESRYYEISGAEEYSAMSSAQGKVQHLNYTATFPLLLNVGGEPTYFMALKDSAGLVKSYAMLNIEKYQTVAIGDSVAQCEDAYKKLLNESGLLKEEEKQIDKVQGKIVKIAQAVRDGNSHYYIMLENSQEIYDISVADYVDIIRYNVGDEIQLEYYTENGIRMVTGITTKRL